MIKMVLKEIVQTPEAASRHRLAERLAKARSRRFDNHLAWRGVFSVGLAHRMNI